MDEHQNIYKTKDREPEKPENPVLVETTPAQMRARTMRHSIGFTVLMLALLGLSAWFIYLQEQKTEKPSIEPGLFGTTSLVPGRPAESNLASSASPEPRRAAPPAPAPIAPPAGSAFKIEPERMAQAMGETRVAKDYL